METSLNTTEEKILALLKEVSDPEIPAISVVDLGIITAVSVAQDGAVKIKMTPTFVGCPALHYMQNEIREKVVEGGYKNVEVEIDLESKWSTNKISVEGKQKLKEFGLAPPGKFKKDFDLNTLRASKCPRCGSDNTVLRSPFGSTLCRAIHYCNECKDSYEQFKPL